jgi:adenylate cyclase
MFVRASSPDAARPVRGRVVRLLRRWPFVALFVLAILSNGTGSAFNIVYNKLLIVDTLTLAQKAAFWSTMLPVYNLVAYPVCLGLMVWLLLPLSRCLRALRAGELIKPAQLERCRRRLVNLPFHQVCVNFLGWLPGAVVFPLGICLLGGWHNAASIGGHFAVSFVVSALMSTVQTFFLLETFMIEVVYPEFFQEARPAEVLGAWRIPLKVRLLLYWVATAVVPIVSLLAVLLTFTQEHPHFNLLGSLALATAAGGILCSALIAFLAGRSLLGWVHAQARATEEITLGNYEYRLDERRPDEFGQLTDRFNDMAGALARARRMRQTVGQLIRPDVLSDILDYYTEMGGDVREVTVLFADIRGFTRRSAGAAPDRVVGLLNRFFSLAVAAVEAEGGLVNKFLGDGFMALFGVPRPRPDHADRAVSAALALLKNLESLNRELAAEGQAPLTVGIGIHTGPALVGCIGATLTDSDGRSQMRREFTAIGETVNLGQRVEQLTKQLGGPVLLTEQTRAKLRCSAALTCLGPQQPAGHDGTLVLYRVEATRS